MKVLIISANFLPASPSGPAYIAGAALEAGHDVEVFEALFAKDLIGELKAHLNRFTPDVVAISIRLVHGFILDENAQYGTRHLDLRISALRDRIRWKWPKGWKAWALAGIVLILGMRISMVMGPANRVLASVPGFIPPEWWPGASNPTIQVEGAVDVFPDITLQGNYLFVLLYLIIGLIFNIFGEEIYYRGYLLPRMRRVFGRWDWVANGFLFTLKHIYQRWLFPGILVGGLAFAFAAGPLGSLPLAMVYHWVGNFLFNMIFLIMAPIGMG